MEKTSWSIHVEFAVIFFTLLGGFYLNHSESVRAHERIDRHYEMFCDVLNELRSHHGRLCVLEEKIKSQ